MRHKEVTGDSAEADRPFYFRFKRGTLLVLLAVLLVFPSACGRQGGGAPWNVLLITIDTLRADRLGCYGGAGVLTPNLDRLAAEGILFANAFAAMPITLPSHTSIMTGLYPRHHGVLSHAYTLAEEHRTAAELFHDQNYQTIAFVSSHVLDSGYGLDQGFDVYWERFQYDPKEANRIRQRSGFDILTEAVINWSDRAAVEPFFAWVHWFHPHKPYQPPPPFGKLYDHRRDKTLQADVETFEEAWKGTIELAAGEVEELRRLYDGEVAYTDQQVGIALGHLQEKGLLDRTIVVVTADHGEMLYERERYFGHDIMLFDPSIRVPLILWAPGLVPAGKIIDTTVRSVDLLPTLAKLTGYDVPEGAVDGRSFLPAIQGDEMPDVPILAELFPPKKEWKTEPRHSVQMKEWKLIRIDGEESPALYNLKDDPGETNDLAGADEKELDKLEGLLQKLTEVDVRMREGDLSPEEERRLRALGYLGN